MTRCFALVLVSTFLSPSFANTFSDCPAPLASYNPQGEVLSGSTQNLLAAYRTGRPIRVGWRLDWDGDGDVDISHWADAPFLSEYRGALFAQVPEIHRQTPQRGEVDIRLPDRWQKWTGLISSNGTLHSRMREDEVVHTWNVETHWCEVVSPTTIATPSCTPGWQLLVRTSTDGAVLEGEKGRLFEAVRLGWPLRLAWGARSDTASNRSVEHVAYPEFVTIAGGSELFAQIPEHIAQESYWDADRSRFDRPAVLWRGMLGTDGSFDAVWVDRASGEVVNRVPQRAQVAWFGDVQCLPGEPAELAVVGGVVRDDGRARGNSR